MRSRKRIAAKRDRTFRLPPYFEARTPQNKGPLFDFIMSVEGEVDYLTALREFQAEWCLHPSTERRVIAVRGSVVEGDAEFDFICDDCGLIQTRKGRPASHVRT